MNRFELVAPEETRVGKSRRVLHLAKDQAHPLVAALTLSEATGRLKDALANLPSLAGTIENALLGGLEAGSLGSPLSTLHWTWILPMSRWKPWLLPWRRMSSR